MPEGDTIHRTAAALRAALLGKPMTHFEAPRLVGVRPTLGSRIERVESRGKHLEIGWDDGVVLHTHMRMSGSWHLYRKGENWRRSMTKMRVIIEAEGWQAVCFSAPVVETYRLQPGGRPHPTLGGLGPDLCKADADLGECVDRMARLCDEDTTVADALLDQRIACGVGNVYKSEVCWAVGLHPFTSMAAVPVELRAEIIDTAARLLRANLGGPARITVPGVPGGLAVYGRTGKPCFRCGHPIEVRKHGEQARVTYWCPGCQERLLVPEPEPEPEPAVDEAAVAAVGDVDGWDLVEEGAEPVRGLFDDDDDGDVWVPDAARKNRREGGSASSRDADEVLDDEAWEQQPEPVRSARRYLAGPTKVVDPLLARNR